MFKQFGLRGWAAALAMCVAAMGPSPALAQTAPATATLSVSNVNFDLARRSLSAALPTAQKAATDALKTVTATFGQRPFASEVAWLYKGGWGLQALIDKYAAAEQLDEEMNCLATAVYFEARGETAAGQLAVARVVMNRAASGKYPSTWCGTVKQPWQFSFVRHGRFPSINRGSAGWARAVAVAKLAAANVVPSIPGDVLWYHADYVSPVWGARLNRVEKIGAHIFYRS